MHRLMLFVLFLGWFSVSGVAQAHDMWIEPTTFTPPSNALVSVKLRISDIPSTAKPVRRSQDQILRFLIHDGDQERPVIGRDGADPAGLLRPPSSGLQVIGYQIWPALLLSEIPFTLRPPVRMGVRTSSIGEVRRAS